MKHYTDTIPLPLAEKLKEKGMPLGRYVWLPNGMTSRKDEANLAYFDDQLIPYCTYAEVFDWLMEKGMQILLFWNNDGCNISCDAEVWSFKIGFTKLERKDTWHEAANAAIEKALGLI